MNASSIVILFFTAVAAGYLLGKVRIGGITPGSSGVLIVSVIIGAALSTLGVGTGEAAGSFSLLSSLGTALFVSCIGLSAGSSFSLSAKRRGIMCLLIGAGTTLVAFLFILAISRVFETDRSVLLGILCGSLTTTPALSALSGIEGVSQPLASAGYGAAYLFGVTVTVAAVQLTDRAGKRSLMKRSMADSASDKNRAKRSETEKATDRICKNEDAKCKSYSDCELNSDIVSTEPCVSKLLKKFFSNSVTFGADQSKKADEEGEKSPKTAKPSTEPGVSNEPKNNFYARAEKGENLSKSSAAVGEDRQKRVRTSTLPGVPKRLKNLFLHCGLTEPKFEKLKVEEGEKSQKAVKTSTLPGVSKPAKTTGELSVFGTVALISVTAVSGSLIGKIKIPFAGVGLGSSGGILIVGFLLGALFKASVKGIPRKNTVDPLRMLGLFMFFIGSGVPAGEAVGGVITPFNAALGMVVSLLAVSFACVTAKLAAGKKSVTTPSVIGGAMTSTPALNILTEQGSSPPDTVAYSAAYLGALFTAVVGIRALAALM